ncbi:MAG TPA: hypothetical protein VEN99_05480 [Acidimicrobiia bacterium]|nr:hypothetical protein [Acidimicrobiia bacterium]
MNDRSFLRLGAAAAVVGALLALAGNLLHPRFGDIADVDLYRKIAGSDRWLTSDLLIIAALVLSTAGLVAIARSLHGGGMDGALARYAGVAAMVGGAMAIMQTGVDAFAFRQAARAFSGAPAQDLVGAFWATNAIDKLGVALFATWTFVFLGVVPLLLAAAAFRTRRYPLAMTTVGAIGGLGCAVVGVVNLVRLDQSATEIPFLVGSLLVTAWLLWAGVVLWQQTADEGRAVQAAQPFGRPATA